jgi:hypothetical protein
MKEHFSEAFQLLFMNSKIIMREVLRLKFQSSLNCEKKEFIKQIDYNFLETKCESMKDIRLQGENIVDLTIFDYE